MTLNFPSPPARRKRPRAKPLLPVLVGRIALLLLLVEGAQAGGSKYVAGVSFFDPTVKGSPLTWNQGAVTYYTDQGNLSPILQQSDADALVAAAFSRWTSVPTAALAATRAGQLSEDVNGSNVIVGSDGSITLPADILPSATDKPVAIVYDADGKVTDALLGAGASLVDYCYTNAVFGGLDNFGADAHLLHALVIINGICAQSTAQVPDLTYRLVRVLGRVLGLDWSQVNLNVLSGIPPAVPEDYAGFPVLHPMDYAFCLPISLCYPNADQPKMDDRAALSRLYPVTPQNQSNFPGKQLFYENTVRIHGSVRFVDAGGQSAQPMQGVNVVARWVDPSTGLPSRQYVAASVSGFLFRGNAGNTVTGFTDSRGQPYDRFGSDDVTVEGYFDLAGLEIPDGASSARYQLTVEALDPVLSAAVGPYGPYQVRPSGMAQPILLTVNKGGALQQDILMPGSATQAQDWLEPESYDAPASMPASGHWIGSLSGYGDADYFRFTGQAYRSLSVEVLALDEGGVASQDKAQPVVGIWSLAAPPGSAPGAATPSAFNTLNFGMTRLDAILLAATDFRIGIADYRGDGRPDFRYQARVLYGDQVTPARASVLGGTALTLDGLGFRAGVGVGVGSASAPLLARSANEMLALVPPMADGVQTITLSDPATGGSSSLTDVLTYGAGPTDLLRLLQGSNPATPVGGQPPNPIQVQALAADGVTPVGGASVVFSTTPATPLSVCGGAPTCTVVTDESGETSTRLTVAATGSTTIQAALAPASYNPPQVVMATVLGTTSSLDLTLLSPYLWVAQGANLDVPLTARTLNNGAPLTGTTLAYQVMKGSGTLSSGNATTDANGYATTTLHLAGLAGDVQVTVCVAPANNPCQTFYITAVPLSATKLEPVAGSRQVIPVGQNFQPVTVRVTDSAAPPNPVRGVSVVFNSMVCRPNEEVVTEVNGEIIVTHPTTMVILGSSQVAVPSGADGLASLVPSAGGLTGPVDIKGTATAGTGAALPFEAQVLEALPQTGSAATGRNNHRSQRLDLSRTPRD